MDEPNDLDDAFTLDEPIPETADKEADDAAAAEKLQQYKLAIEQEFEDGVKYSEGKLTPPQIKSRTVELLTQGVPKAVAAMVYLCSHARSEQVQLAAAKFVIERAIGKEATGLVGDPMDALLASLQANGAK